MVDEVEGIEVGTIDIEDGDDVGVGFGADRDDDFAVGSGGTSDVSGEFVDVWDNEGAVLCPSLTTDSTVIGDTGASDRALKGT